MMPNFSTDSTADSIFCHYCGCQIYQGARQDGRKRPLATIDHVIPKSRAKGSGDHTTTKVPACMPCNQEKGALTIEEYRVVLAFRYGYIQTGYKFPGEEY